MNLTTVTWSHQNNGQIISMVVTYRLGSVRMRTNFATASSDIILQSARLYPFGEELSPATANDRDKFATYHRDNSTGLDYAMNRYYGSTLGRFISPDPFGDARI
ncbi:MAG: RHS repeat-associated core domain-containing protein [Acidobacteriota bacterium]